VTNTTEQPLRFDHRAVSLRLNVPDGPSDVRAVEDLPTRFHLYKFHAIAASGPIPPGATRVGWERFGLPSSVVPLLNTGLGSLGFLPARPTGGLPHLGMIRLTNPATPQGAAAARVRFQ
jgi:hypothetical protein